MLEAAYSIASLGSLSPAILNELPVTASSSRPSPALERRNSKLETVTPADPRSPTPVVASADLQVEVLRLLNLVGADMGEQISAIKAPDGLLHVDGIVESATRKVEIMRTLEPVMKDPTLRIEIQTVAEAIAQQTRGRSKASPTSIIEERVELNSEAMAANPELHRYFGTDEQVRQFAARMVSQSSNSMRHVFALRRLIARFSPSELAELSPGAKSKWLALIREHANAYRNEALSLRRELRSIFFASSPMALNSFGFPRLAPTSKVLESRQVKFLHQSKSESFLSLRSASTLYDRSMNLVAHPL